MPHPRLHKGRVWLLKSGYGQLGWFNEEEQIFMPVIDCPGFLRSLVFVDNYAIVTISKPLASEVFSGLPLEKIIKKIMFYLSAEY